MKKYFFLFSLMGVASLFGCSHSEEHAKNELEEITLSGGMEVSTETGSITTKASSSFPNAGKIGVIAAYNNTNGIDWKTYDDIQNAEATTSSPAADQSYAFDWAIPHYWPCDDCELVFLAYSPVAADGSAVSLNTDHTRLELTLQNTNMPDVLYASANKTQKSYKKTDKTTVALGEFRHALSQVKVVITGENLNDHIKVKSLTLETPSKATFNLLTDQLDLSNEVIKYTLIDKEISFKDAVAKQDMNVYVYPRTESASTVSITLIDGIAGEVKMDFKVNKFKIPNVTPETGVTCERAKVAVLTIHVVGKNINNPETSINLQGQLKGWIDMGEYGTTIN